MAKELVACHSMIAELLDSLPTREHDAEAQSRLIAALEAESERCAAELAASVGNAGERSRGDDLCARMTSRLHQSHF
jgi:hypothetical protein